MFSFKNKLQAPPGGKYYYTVPETGVFVESYRGFDDLYAQVRQHYAINRRSCPPNIEPLVDDYMCRYMPEGTCKGDDGGKPVVTRPMSYFKLIERLETFFRGKTTEFVPVDEATIRATICVRCPSNWLGMCVSCNNLRETAYRMVGKKKVPQSPWLGICKEHMLPLDALVFVRSPTRVVTSTYPETCWIPRKGNA